jgi:hypothetical protein
MPWMVEFFATGDDFKPSENDYPFTQSLDVGTIQTEGR